MCISTYFATYSREKFWTQRNLIQSFARLTLHCSLHNTLLFICHPTPYHAPSPYNSITMITLMYIVHSYSFNFIGSPPYTYWLMNYTGYSKKSRTFIPPHNTKSRYVTIQLWWPIPKHQRIHSSIWRSPQKSAQLRRHNLGSNIVSWY